MSFRFLLAQRTVPRPKWTVAPIGGDTTRASSAWKQTLTGTSSGIKNSKPRITRTITPDAKRQRGMDLPQRFSNDRMRWLTAMLSFLNENCFFFSSLACSTSQSSNIWPNLGQVANMTLMAKASSRNEWKVPQVNGHSLGKRATSYYGSLCLPIETTPSPFRHNTVSNA